jgi:hypothetical protein
MEWTNSQLLEVIDLKDYPWYTQHIKSPIVISGGIRHLFIHVAKWTAKRAHSVSVGDVGELPLEHFAKVQYIFQSSITTRRPVKKGNRAHELITPLLQVLILPSPPHSINHCMVKEERL